MFRDGTLDGKEVAAVDAEKDIRDAGWVLVRSRITTALGVSGFARFGLSGWCRIAASRQLGESVLGC